MRTVYGPYTRKDGRKHMCIKENGKVTSISYPKYLLQELGYVIPEGFTVDHIDRDFTNDSIENFQILPRSYHVKLDALRAKPNVCICKECGKSFTRKGSQLRHNAKLKKAGPFCGKVCAGLYGQKVQVGKKPLPIQDSPETEYYQLKKRV